MIRVIDFSSFEKPRIHFAELMGPDRPKQHGANGTSSRFCCLCRAVAARSRKSFQNLVSPMQMKILVALSLFSLSASAADPIVPTSDPGSDCLAARISAKKTSLNDQYDNLYCSINKLPAAFANCLKNASDEDTVVFFTDRCNEASEGAYVSFNGATHHVSRAATIKNSPVTFACTFKAEDLEVRVVPGKILSRFYDGEDLLGVTAAVEVVIKYGAQSVTVQGTYDSEP
ncbi:MAG: hypothetical protein ABI866_10780 [Dokdonella sp.]